MLTIDRLSLTLPTGFEERAAAIAELIAKELATMPLSGSAIMDDLRVDLTLPSAGATNEDVAASIAGALHRGILSGRSDSATMGSEE